MNSPLCFLIPVVAKINPGPSSGANLLAELGGQSVEGGGGGVNSWARSRVGPVKKAGHFPDSFVKCLGVAAVKGTNSILKKSFKEPL